MTGCNLLCQRSLLYTAGGLGGGGGAGPGKSLGGGPGGEAPNLVVRYN